MKELTILASDFFTKNVILPVLKTLAEQYRGFQDYHLKLKNAVFDDLPSDPHFSILPCAHPHTASYINETLLETEINLYASPEYLEKYGLPKTLAELKKHTLIKPIKGDLLRLANISYLPMSVKEDCFETDTLTAALELAEDGFGITAFNDKAFELKKMRLEKIPKLEFSLPLPNKPDLPLDITCKMPYVLNIHESIKDLPLVQHLRQGILEKLKI